MLSLASAASLAFTAPANVIRAAGPAPLAPTMVEKSRALPFLKRPPALDGTMAGDVGFDPLGISTTIVQMGGDLNYVREAELMHGRQSMLATVGFLWPAVTGQKIAPWVDGLDVSKPLEVQYQLPNEITAQLFVSMLIAEGIRARILFSGNNEPGEHFDADLKAKLISTFKLDTPEAMMEMKTKEIKHCRLAMIAVTGMFFQEAWCGSIWPLI